MMHTSTDTAHTNDDAKMEPVLILHGTSAALAKWWRPGSEFCIKLDAALAKRGSRARCWYGLENVAQDFKWSGRNSEYHRSLAATEIKSKIDDVIHKKQIRSFHVLAHSHGGNVILKSIASYGLRHPTSVVLLGTPVYQYLSTSPHPQLANIANATAGLALVFILALMSGAALVLPWISSARDFYHTAMVPFVLILILAPMIAYMIETRRAERAKFLQEVDVYHIQSRYDEAISLLKECINLKKDPPEIDPADDTAMYILSTRFLNLSYDVFKEINLTKSPLQIAANIKSRAMSTKSILAFLAISPTFLLLMGFLLFDWIFAQMWKSTMRCFRRRMVRLGIRAICRIALGEDAPFERIMSVGPSKSCFNSISYVSVPDQIEARLAERAQAYYSDVIAAVYKPQANYVEASHLARENLVGAVDIALTDMKLTHCQYYQDEWCIEKIAELIARRSR